MEVKLRRYHTENNYPEDQSLIHTFLTTFSESDIPKYMLQIQNRNILIDMDDLFEFNPGLATRIEENTPTYINMIASEIDMIMVDSDDLERDAFVYHRIARMKEKYPDMDVLKAIPGALLRRYQLGIRGRRAMEITPFRMLRANKIGKMTKIRGLVTKVTDVKPAIIVATYVCDSCGSETYQEVNGETFTALDFCRSDKCKIRNIKGTLNLQTRGSRFAKFQGIQIQELSTDVPKGCIPRTIKMEWRGFDDAENQEDSSTHCRPGDVIIVSGVFMPRPYYGFRKMKAGLLHDTYFSVSHIEHERPVENKSAGGSLELAPEIYGMDDVKKLLLLMMVGSPELVREDGMRIRGDINVMLLGDPGIAKSQLLKTVSKLCRGVYTTGRGSSGVGLTANVCRDSVTGELVLEGGALVLSDKGVCCIDELDKMNEIDRMSIHEVLEQQTVSINKAGINATLNARCAVLAAANPIRGSYNPLRSIEANTGLPNSLISRFDVIVLLRDEANIDADERLARHVTMLHSGSNFTDYDGLRAHIEKARAIDPVLPQSLTDKLVSAYVEARKEMENLTPRYLLSLVRLSLANARFRLSAEVSADDVEESLRLMRVFKIKRERRQQRQVAPKHQIYNAIMTMDMKSIPMSRIYAELSRFGREVIDGAIQEFADCGVWVVENGTLLILD